MPNRRGENVCFLLLFSLLDFLIGATLQETINQSCWPGDICSFCPYFGAK